MENGKRRWKVIESVVIYDVFGFFQKSFVGALKEFKIATEDELEEIERMKLQRGNFKLDDLDSILHYNMKECELLVRLMELVSDRLESIGLKLHSWHGAGAVAAALLNKKKVKKHVNKPEGEEHHLAVMSAYFGGRINCAKVGEFGKVYGYDIISAYPSIMKNLASLQGMIERETDSFIPDYPYAVYHVKWNIDRRHKITPFPFRSKDGKIDYPYCAEGYYWYYEVNEALKQFPGQIEIVKGYVFENIGVDSRPFEFIGQMFEERKTLKANGDMAQLCIKLGLNSLYGKTAQGIGYRGQPPPFQCYIYAGMITSGTRAMMLSAAMQNEESVISFATDGIVTQTPLDLNLTNSLGNWELTEYESAFLIKPGFYQLTEAVDTSPKWHPPLTPHKHMKKVRGFPPSAIDFDVLRAAWKKDGLNAVVKVVVRNFIGMKSRSVNRPWLSWMESPKAINYWPSKGEPELLTTEPLSYRLIPPSVIDGVSHIYIKGLDKDYDEKEHPEFEVDVENM